MGEDVDSSAVPRGSIVVDAHVLYKHKADNRETCRIAAMGDRLPPRLGLQTFASVISDHAKFFIIALMQAYCASRQELFVISDCDVVGGFLHIPLNPPVPMFLRHPRALPHPLAGRCVRILRESNRLFSLEMSRVLVKAGFKPAPSEPQLFSRFDSRDSALRYYACVTVDDVLILTNSPPMRDSLYAALTARFGSLTINLVSTLHTGIEIQMLPLGAVLLTQDKAIARAASLVGVSQLPPVSLPYDPQFFAPLVGDEVASIEPTVYASLTGKLVQFLKTRHDVRLLVSYL